VVDSSAVSSVDFMLFYCFDVSNQKSDSEIST